VSPTQLALQELAVSILEEPGHLGEPCRRLLTQKGHQVVALGHTAELAQGFQDGQVGLPRAVVLDTLPVRNPELWVG
jgi:hypothetical protein